MKKSMCALALAVCFSTGQSAVAAGIPVIDGSSLAQAMLQVQAWGKQFEQMQRQFQQMEQQYASLNGVRGMADLVNNPALRNYLPDDYQQMLNGEGMAGLSGSIDSIRSAARIVDADSTGLAAASDAARAFSNSQNQNALNRAVGEEGYRQASQRFNAIQALLDKVNQAPEQKDILDLQARIQAEEVMMTNEQNKLNTMAFLAQTQRDIQQQQAREISMQATKGEVPRF